MPNARSQCFAATAVPQTAFVSVDMTDHIGRAPSTATSSLISRERAQP